MTLKSEEISRYGIGEWYGRPIEAIPSEDKVRYATLKGKNKEQCPFRPVGTTCSKSGGVCSLVPYLRKPNGRIVIRQGLVTLCPFRFWQDYFIFRAVGNELLGTNAPTLIKEVGFLRPVDHAGNTLEGSAGRIDMVLARVGEKNEVDDWCALEIQAVYFSGKKMGVEFPAIADAPDRLVFPVEQRRPDFRSSAPKRLMPQLQTKVPSLRRWGKKTAVVVDEPFFLSIGPMKEVPQLSNADIAWFVVTYDDCDNRLRVLKTVYTTLENSVEGLTAGVPVAKQEFEHYLNNYLQSTRKTIRKKIVKLS